MFKTPKTIRANASPNMAGVNSMENIQSKFMKKRYENSSSDDELVDDIPPQYVPDNKEKFGASIIGTPDIFYIGSNEESFEERINNAFLTASLISIFIFAIGLILLQHYIGKEQREKQIKILQEQFTNDNRRR